MLYIGCAVWAYDGWEKIFFPPGLPKDQRLNAYSRRLTAVECNSTFYAMPTLGTVRNWAQIVPDSFRFSPKFPRTITHTAQLNNIASQATSFIGVMRLLGAKLGPLMLQLPPGFGPVRLPTLRTFLESLPRDLAITVEVRHPDWFTGDHGKKLDDVLADVGASRVVFDVRPAHNSDSPDADPAKERKPDVPLIPEATQQFVVVRYISSPLAQENEPYLKEWIPRLANWITEGRTVYFYVHCPKEETSPFTARDIYRRVAAEVELPPLPWDEIEKPISPKDYKQLSLFGDLS